MGKLFAAITVFVAAATITAAAPAWAVAPEAPQVFLHETDQVTASARLIFKDEADTAAIEGAATVVEHSLGLMTVSTTIPGPGKPAVADLKTLPGSPMRMTTTTTVSWTPAVLPPKPGF